MYLSIPMVIMMKDLNEGVSMKLGVRWGSSVGPR